MQIAHLWECIRNREYLPYLKYYTISTMRYLTMIISMGLVPNRVWVAEITVIPVTDHMSVSHAFEIIAHERNARCYSKLDTHIHVSNC